MHTPSARALSLLLFVTLLPSASAAAAPPVHRLIRPALTVPGDVHAPVAAEIRRSRLATIDPGPLSERRARRGGQTPVEIRLSLDLFDDASLRATLQHVTAGLNGAEVYEGKLDGAPGTIVLSVTANELFGNIKTESGWYQVRYAGRGLHAVLEMDPAALPDELKPMEADPVALRAAATSSDATAAPDDGSVIDVLVMYTPGSGAAVGGAAGINNLINTAIAETNTAYANSGVTQRLRLVHTAETESWVFNGSKVNADHYTLGDALALLRADGDGAMDAVHRLRDTYGADLVALMYAGRSQCGVAYVMRNVSADFAPLGFSVIHYACATGLYTFGHELGHNMGLMHDRINSEFTGAYPYSYGWQDPSSLFRTIMAYNCRYGCPRVQHFANPAVQYNGAPTGSRAGSYDEADAAQTLNKTAPTVANFRPSVPCTYSLLESSTSVGASGSSASTRLVVNGIGCSWKATSNAGFITLTGPSSGTTSADIHYSVDAAGGPGRTGTILIADQTFTINQAGAPGVGCSGTPISCPYAVSAVLSVSDCSADGGNLYMDRYTFHGTAGDAVTITAASAEIDTFLLLLDPSGGVAAANDNDSDTNSRIAHTLSVSGTWTALIRAASAGDTGGYDLAVSGCLVPERVKADFDRDWKADLLWRHTGDGRNLIWFMDGSVTRYKAFLPQNDPNVRLEYVGDFNGDGKADILWRNHSNGQIVVWLMDGATVLGYNVVSTVASLNTRIAGVADFNGDGRDDIVWRNYNNGNNQVWLMNGSSIQSVLVLAPVTNTNVKFEYVGDFNGDRLGDILLRNYDNGQVTMWLMDGSTTIGTGVLTTVANPLTEIGGVGDFDDDGKFDIVWRNYSNGNNQIWLMNGLSIKTAAPLAAVPDLHARIAGVSDFDANGKADILWRNLSPSGPAMGETRMWFMNATSVVADVSLEAVSDYSWVIMAPR